MRCCCSGAMPQPVSLTCTLTNFLSPSSATSDAVAPLFFAFAEMLAETVTRPPEAVNCNLMSNGLQFTASGGRVTVSASISANAKNNGATASEVAEDGERKFVRVQVSDTGCGIAPEQQQRIFERFYQIPHTPTSRSSGQGLGLAIVKMIVELHGGQVMVESTPGQGSTFSCLLPCLLG